MFLWVTVYLKKKKLSNRELNSYRKISKVKEHFGKKKSGGQIFRRSSQYDLRIKRKYRHIL